MAKVKSKPFFFYEGPFSQWYPAPFSINGAVFNCAEQYMMYRKALHFGDSEVAQRILSTDDPGIQKGYGRQVRNFDADTWAAVAEGIVYEGNIAKFRQNLHLAKVLIKTGDREIVEASPDDRIWGIGLSESDARIHDRTQWRGKNLLGVILMRVRKDLCSPA